MDEVRYMISETSRQVGVEDHVLRYWEKELELPINRNEMNNRYYYESDIKLLQTVKKLKDQGFQLKAIRMMLPSIDNNESLDAIGGSELKDNLDGKVNEMIDEVKINETDNGTSLVAQDEVKEVSHKPVEKMDQFKAIMNEIITGALKENNLELKEDIGSNITENVMREMKFLMRLKEEKEEDRYRKLDMTIRDYQKSRMMAAAALDSKGKKKSKFFRKNTHVYI